MAPGSDKLALAEQLMSCFELGDSLAVVGFETGDSPAVLGCSPPTGPTEHWAEPGMLQTTAVTETRTPAFSLSDHLTSFSWASCTQIECCSQPSSSQHRGLIHESLC